MLGTIPPMKVKGGLRKGLKYISNIFEQEKEQEMVIGHPTDVKHVAHIGFDGPAVNNPTWMTEYHSAPLSTTFGQDRRQTGSPKSASQEIPLGGVPPPSPARDEAGPAKPRRARRHSAPETSDSSSRERGSRHTRKNESAGSSRAGSDSPASESESRRGRRNRKPDNTNGSECDPSTADLPTIPKQKKKERRSKGSDSGSSRSSRRSKNTTASDPGAVTVEDVA